MPKDHGLSWVNKTYSEKKLLYFFIIGLFQLVNNAKNLVIIVVVLRVMLFCKIYWENPRRKTTSTIPKFWPYDQIETSLLLASK